MKITKINFAKTVESNVMGVGVWTKIGVEGEVGENENVANAIEEAKAVVEDAHLKSGAMFVPTQSPAGRTQDIFFNESSRKWEG